MIRRPEFSLNSRTIIRFEIAILRELICNGVLTRVFNLTENPHENTLCMIRCVNSQKKTRTKTTRLITKKKNA